MRGSRLFGKTTVTVPEKTGSFRKLGDKQTSHFFEIIAEQACDWASPTPSGPSLQSARNRPGMAYSLRDINVKYLDVLGRLLLVCLDVLNFVNYVQPLHSAPKDGVLVVKPGLSQR
jgi:hypothetical protein